MFRLSRFVLNEHFNKHLFVGIGIDCIIYLDITTLLDIFEILATDHFCEGRKDYKLVY